MGPQFLWVLKITPGNFDYHLVLVTTELHYITANLKNELYR